MSFNKAILLNIKDSLGSSFRLQSASKIKLKDRINIFNIHHLSYLVLIIFFSISVDLLFLAIIYPKNYDTYPHINLNTSIQPSAVNADFVKDTDLDGFSDAIEEYVGTDINKACASEQNDGLPSKTWPADLSTDNSMSSGLNILDFKDLEAFKTPVNRLWSKHGDLVFDKRYDLNGDGRISNDDIGVILNLTPQIFNGENAFLGPVCK